jgi:E1A/CREB-binding protein
LRARIEEDFQQRKTAAGREAVPIIDGLTLRVVNVTSKENDTKPKYLEAMGQHNYAASFPYKQKVILLFQRIEGVDVLLFIVYVQVRNVARARDFIVSLPSSSGNLYLWRPFKLESLYSLS